MEIVISIAFLILVIVLAQHSRPVRPVKVQPLVIESPPIAVELPKIGRPKDERPIDDLFDSAWLSGTRTYSGLIEYVRATTGTGTSKTRVKKWKVDRGLINE
jgi:hypothetical protein